MTVVASGEGVRTWPGVCHMLCAALYSLQFVLNNVGSHSQGQSTLPLPPQDPWPLLTSLLI